MRGRSTGIEEAGPRPAPAAGWRRWALAAGLGAAAAALHLATAADGWGLFRDELYYLANARHLGAGYVDHPPLIGWLTAAVTALLGSSQTALRLWPGLAAGATVFAACGMARELGGGRAAQLLAGTATALAPISLALFGVLSMNATDLLGWALAFWVLARLLGRREDSLWLAFGAVIGVALLNKWSPILIVAGLVGGLLLTRDLRHLTRKAFWLGALLALALASPYLIWQFTHGWPTLEFLRNASQGKNLDLSPPAYLASQVDLAGHAALPLALAGLLVLLAGPAFRPWRALGWALGAALVLLAVQQAKPYYFAPAYAPLFAAGGVAVERWTSSRRPLRWLPGAYAGLILIYGLAALPLVKPVLGLEATVAYQAALGREAGTDERKEVGRLPQFFADRLGWQGLAETVAGVHHALPAAERAVACVFARNYGQAGALEHHGAPLGMPPVVSGHNSYWLWGPGDCSGEVLLVVGGEAAELAGLFGSVEAGAVDRCPDCMPYEAERTIWIARDLRLPLAEAWEGVRHYD